MIYQEFDLPETNLLYSYLKEMLEFVCQSDTPNQIVGTWKNTPPIDSKTLLLRQDDNIQNTSWMRRFWFKDDKLRQEMSRIFVEQTGVVPRKVEATAKTWYPENGYLGWHVDKPGWRFYAAWAEGESFFRYQDPFTKKIITSYDKPGWNFRIFDFSLENPFWHCVYAKDVRVSVGYRFVAALSSSQIKSS